MSPSLSHQLEQAVASMRTAPLHITQQLHSLVTRFLEETGWGATGQPRDTAAQACFGNELISEQSRRGKVHSDDIIGQKTVCSVGEMRSGGKEPGGRQRARMAAARQLRLF